jgi:hypothetical protein
MKPIKIVALAAFFTIAVASTAFINTRLLKKANTENKGFAVVELFTSEGCSSCPPADELVAKIQKESNGKPVYILAYHVDYWNRLGWKDVFSNADFSKRQNDYAKYLRLQSVYTPQVIVNGKTEFVGSEENTLRSAITTALQKSPAEHLALTVSGSNHGQASLKYSIEGTGKNVVLMVAVLQKSAQTKVERGENAGHTLSHVQIVHKLQEIALRGNNGTAIIPLPNGYDDKKWEIIGFLQNPVNGSIEGAARATSEVSANVIN